MLTFPNERTIAETRPAAGAKEAGHRRKLPRPAVKGQEGPSAEGRRCRSSRGGRRSPRRSTHDNPLLARAMVNRVWAMLTGRGIGHPGRPDGFAPPAEPSASCWRWLARTLKERL